MCELIWFNTENERSHVVHKPISHLFDVCPLRDTFFHPTEVAPGDPLIRHWIVTDVSPKIGDDWVGVR
jgi:hypothetical protein